MEVTLIGTVKDTARALLPLLKPKSESGHLDTMLAHYQRARRRLDALAVSTRDRGGIHPQFVAATIDRLAAADAVFLPDVGTPTVWAARYLKMNGRRPRGSSRSPAILPGLGDPGHGLPPPPGHGLPPPPATGCHHPRPRGLS